MNIIHVYQKKKKKKKTEKKKNTITADLVKPESIRKLLVLKTPAIWKRSTLQRSRKTLL